MYSIVLTADEQPANDTRDGSTGYLEAELNKLNPPSFAKLG
jgi:hypothetical protein